MLFIDCQEAANQILCFSTYLDFLLLIRGYRCTFPIDSVRWDTCDITLLSLIHSGRLHWSFKICKLRCVANLIWNHLSVGLQSVWVDPSLDLSEEIFLCLSLERNSSCQEYIKDYTTCPNISSWATVFLLWNDFWTHIWGCATEHSKFLFWDDGKSKVNDFYDAGLGVIYDVIWLHVSMRDVAWVHISQSRKDLCHYLSSYLLWDCSTIDCTKLLAD